MNKTKFEPLLAVVLLLALFGQTALGSIRLSLTTDEPMHIAMGYTSLTIGDYSLLPAHIHPPFTNEWAAWPLVLRTERPDPRQVPGWEEKNLFQFSAQLLDRLGPIEAIELATRVPIMLLSLLLGALVYRWASDIGGGRAGLAALLLYTFDPGVISSSQLATTDIGSLCFGLLATFVAYRAARRPTIRLILLIGIALGLSMASKVSGLLFAPMIALLVGVTLLRAYWGQWKLMGKQALAWAGRGLLICGLAAGVVWAVYGFQLAPLPGSNVPIPATTHWLILQAFNQHTLDGHMAFMLGQVSQFGWRGYFPLALAIKTPLPTLLLLAVALGRLLKRSIKLLDALWLLAVPLVYFAGAVLSSIDIGYRHLLPIFPFLFIFIGVQIANSKFKIQNLYPVTLDKQVSNSSSCHLVTSSPCHLVTLSPRHLVSRSPHLFVSALFIWLITGAVFIFPNYQAYFNELIGGADHGWRYLADSNTDWGQALKQLAEYQQANGIEQVQLSMFTFIDPAVYGVCYEALTPMRGDTPAIFPSRFNPPPGDYVISATTLDGIPLADPEMFDWFRRRKPDAIIGHVMFYYRVEPAQPPRAWAALCASPAALLDPAQIAEGFGQADLRLAYFDCAQSWLYPTGAQSPGWFVLPNELPEWTRHWLFPLRPSYQQQRSGFSPPFTIYPADGKTIYIQPGELVHVAPSELLLATATQTQPIKLPVTFENGLTLESYTVGPPWPKPGETIYLETVWRVESVPGQLLSLMAHVIGPYGHTVAVGDGLGVPIESWQSGDLFVQRHSLTLPADIPPGQYWLQTGVYWLETGQRWAVQPNQATGDRVLLTFLDVR